MDTFQVVFVLGVQPKWHNFEQWESFRGLVDVPRMCLSRVSFGGVIRFGRYKPTKTQISAIAAVDVLLSDHEKANKPMWAWHAVRRCVSN